MIWNRCVESRVCVVLSGQTNVFRYCIFLFLFFELFCAWSWEPGCRSDRPRDGWQYITVHKQNKAASSQAAVPSRTNSVWQRQAVLNCTQAEQGCLITSSSARQYSTAVRRGQTVPNLTALKQSHDFSFFLFLFPFPSSSARQWVHV